MKIRLSVSAILRHTPASTCDALYTGWGISIYTCDTWRSTCSALIHLRRSMTMPEGPDVEEVLAYTQPCDLDSYALAPPLEAGSVPRPVGAARYNHVFTSLCSLPWSAQVSRLSQKPHYA